MRPYLVLCAVLLIAVAAFGQQPVPPRIYGPCILGCGPFVPLVTTPMVSLQQVSPNPVGASNAEHFDHHPQNLTVRLTALERSRSRPS